MLSSDSRGADGEAMRLKRRPNRARAMRWLPTGAAVLCAWTVGCERAPEWPAIGAKAPLLVGARSPVAAADTGPGAESRFSLTDEARPTLVFFGYTFCPDVCPITLLTMKRLLAGLPEGAEVPRVVFVTVDPKRDTVDRMRTYVDAFDVGVIGVRPTDVEAMKTAWKLNVTFEPVKTSTQSADEDLYAVNHTATVFLFDAQHRLLHKFPHGTPVAKMRRVVGEKIRGKS